MLLTKQSAFSGKMHTMSLNITEEEYKICFDKYMRGTLIQDAFPNLTNDEREFILTGITPEEWDELFKDD